MVCQASEYRQAEETAVGQQQPAQKNGLGDALEMCHCLSEHSVAAAKLELGGEMRAQCTGPES